MPRVAKRGSMPTDVIMPQMGESIFEGTITKWLKKAGDAVEKDEPLFEISTDKVDAEIPSPVAGVLSEIKVAEGATVEINTVVAVVTEAQGTGNREQGSAAGSVASAGGSRCRRDRCGDAADGRVDLRGHHHQWLKKAGDTVEKDEPLFEISTDKVDAEIPSPVAGVLSEIKVQEGATVEINTVVAVIGGAAAGSRRAVPRPGTIRHLDADSAKLAPAGGRVVEWARTHPLFAAGAAHCEGEQPRSRQMAGTGSEGRITKEDVLRHVSGMGRAARHHRPAPQAQVGAGRFGAGAFELRGQSSAHQDARHHCTAHGGEQAHQPARAQRLQSGHDAHRSLARAGKEPLRAEARRQADLYAIHRRGRCGGAAQVSHCQRVARGRIDSLPRSTSTSASPWRWSGD